MLSRTRSAPFPSDRIKNFSRVAFTPPPHGGWQFNAQAELQDTIDEEEAEVPQQQHGQDEGRLAQNVPRSLWLPNAPAAPGGGGQSQSGRRKQLCQKLQLFPGDTLTLWRRR